MIAYVLIGLMDLFSWYVIKCKLFGVCVVSEEFKFYLSYPNES